MRQLNLPAEAADFLSGGADLAVSTSGGKDSQAMLNALVVEHRKGLWPGKIYAIHADLGRAEWQESLPHCEQQCKQLGIDLVVVRRPQGDLVARWQQRMEKLAGTGKPFWSSSKNRYCTSDMKRGPIDKYLRHHGKVVCAIGVRAQESTHRAKQKVWEPRKQICTKKRLAYSWNAIFDWKIEDVWEACGTSSWDLHIARHLYGCGAKEAALSMWPAHPAYVYGNERVSCALSVLATKNDLRVGAKHNPKLYQILTGMEKESGFTFRSDMSLTDLMETKQDLVLPSVLPVQQGLDFVCSC